MKRWYSYIVLYGIVGVFGLSPFRGSDLATMSPVEVVWVEEQQGNVRIVTDGMDTGVGASVSEALNHMKKTSACTVFLDTADYLIMKCGSEVLLEDIAEYLRPSCSICVAREMPDLSQAAGFLGVHEPSVKIKDAVQNATEYPVLRERMGRLILIEKRDTDAAANSVADRRGECTHSEFCQSGWMDDSTVCRCDLRVFGLVQDARRKAVAPMGQCP